MAFPLYFFRYWITMLVVFLISVCSGQELSVSGRVLDAEKHGVPDVLLQLLRSSDSLLVKSEFTDGSGHFEFTGIAAGDYLLQSTAAGFQRSLRSFSLQKTEELPDLVLKPTELALSEVAVTARKPYIERDKGKVILNVENSINAEGATAYDLLSKAPMVRIDNNENIRVAGKSGTVVWIDGKPSPLTGQDLANFLRGLSSSSIEKIEIISNPSARYDAAGSSIINIRLKKDKRIGNNGSITLSYLQGYYPKTNNSISFNHRDKKINVFSSYNYANRIIFTRLKLRRDFFNGDVLNGAYAQDNLFLYNVQSHQARAGADIQLSDKKSIGFVFSSQNTSFNRKSDNQTQVFGPGNIQNSLFSTVAQNYNHYNNYALNVNYRQQFDTLGTELSSDFDAAVYPTSSNQNFETRYYNMSDQEYRNPYKLHGDLNGLLRLLALKNDYSRMIRKWKMEAGQKSSYVVADNNLSFYDLSNGVMDKDTTKSNHFIYTENINAAYLSFSRDYSNWSLQAGLRAEHTFVTGVQQVNGRNFRRNYVQLFPNLVLSKKLNEKNSLEFNYSRRITRPGYEQLNPFKYYIDATAYKEGYPYLKPSTTESFELSHVFRQKIVTMLGFGRTYNNIIETLAPLGDQTNITVQTNRNLGMVDVFTFNGTIPVEVCKWWNTASSFNLYHAAYTGNIANTSINGRGNFVFSLSSVNTFNISDRFSAELSGDYQSKEVYAFDVIQPIWSVNAGLQLKVMKSRGVLRLNVTDIFYTNKIPATVNYTGYYEKFLVQRDSRVGTLSFTYKFGKNTVPAARRRQGGAEDVKQRAGNSGG